MRQHGDPRRDYAGEWRAWRKAHSWTQAELASVLGIARRTVQYIEAGHPPKLFVREKMAALKKKHMEAEA